MPGTPHHPNSGHPRCFSSSSRISAITGQADALNLLMSQ